jgi:hypothetical protein
MLETLRLATASQEVARSHASFVAGMATSEALALDLIRRTRYWVFDPATTTFSPSKFVGYVGMDFQRYDAIREEGNRGDKFDGGLTHQTIAAVVGPYAADATLAAALARWVTSHFGPAALVGIARAKWRFVRLPATSRGLLGVAGGWDGSDELADAIAAHQRTTGRPPPDLDR